MTLVLALRVHNALFQEMFVDCHTQPMAITSANNAVYYKGMNRSMQAFALNLLVCFQPICRISKTNMIAIQLSPLAATATQEQTYLQRKEVSDHVIYTMLLPQITVRDV